MPQTEETLRPLSGWFWLAKQMPGMSATGSQLVLRTYSLQYGKCRDGGLQAEPVQPVLRATSIDHDMLQESFKKCVHHYRIWLWINTY
jgi:hypothetical protein